MKFSIIIPIYNVEAYLKECLDSVLNQSFNDWEAILVDDGSTDSSADIAQNYVKKDARFILLSQTNQGLSAARNTGIKNAHGEYLFFLDSDDWINTESLQKLHTLIVDSNLPDVIRFNYLEYRDERIQDNKTFHFPQYNLLMNGVEFFKKFRTYLPYCACFNLCKKNFIIKNNLFFLEGVLFEDVEWTPRVILSANSILQTDLKLYVYRVRSNSITTSPRPFSQSLDSLLPILESLKNFSTPRGRLEKEMIEMYSTQFVNMKCYHENLLHVQIKKFRKFLSFAKGKYLPFNQRFYMVMLKIHPQVFKFALKFRLLFLRKGH